MENMDKMNGITINTFIKIMGKHCFDNNVDENKLSEFKTFIEEIPSFQVESNKKMIIGIIFQLFNNWKPLNEKNRIIIIDTLAEALKKLEFKKEHEMLVFNLYSFLLCEVYDPGSANPLKENSEEYKLSIIKCMSQLFTPISWDLVPIVYKKENFGKISSLLHLCITLAKNERLRILRISSIQCILSVMKLQDEELPDLNQYKTIADAMSFYLPGIAAVLVKVCTEDEKSGHGIVVAGLKTFAWLVALCGKDYGINEDDIEDLLEVLRSEKIDVKVEEKEFKNIDEVKSFMGQMKRDKNWFAKTDLNLEVAVNLLMKLATSQHPAIRNELMTMCDLVTYYCFRTLPKTSSKAIEIIISLSEDEYDDIADKGKVLLSSLSEKMADDSLKTKIVREMMEQNFYNAITRLPRIFNGLDEREQINSLDLLIGYLSVFQKHRLKQLLFSTANLNRIILSLIHVASLRTDVSLLEEHSVQDLEETNLDNRTPWKVFNFHSKNIESKLERVCKLLAQPDIADIVLDYLMDLFVNDVENRKEVTFIINEIFSVTYTSKDNVQRAKPFISIYLEKEYWDLSLTVDQNEENKCTLKQAQNNVIQICLQIEGIGKMALSLKDRFHELLLKVLYNILEKAGSGNPLLRTAGMMAVTNISKACNYKNVTELINANSDYFSYHVVRKLKRPVHDEGVLNVLAVVMKHSNMNVLPSLSEIIDGVLVQSCDRYELQNATAYLHVFKVFIKCLHKWLEIKIDVIPMKTKEEREKEMEDFKISNLEQMDTDFSDEAVMGKTAEEMWKEDMEEKLQQGKMEEDNEIEVEDYKKPEPPTHIKLTVSILKRSLHFLPSKDQNRKILTLEILKDGVEILKNWEDELLPIVHLVWSPLVNRFKEFETPLIINLSFQLLVTLGRLSKDFIRSRTVKEALPSLSEALKKQSKLSYLKDKGSAYRYTQGYKMQLAVLPEWGRLCYDLDVAEIGVKLFLEGVEPYLSSKQPLKLQECAIDFYKTLFIIDPALGKKYTKELEIKNEKSIKENNNEYDKNCKLILNYKLDVNKPIT